MRYVMTFMDPTGNRKGGPGMAFKRQYSMAPGVPHMRETQAEAIKRMLDWLDTSPFGRTLDLEDIKWAVFPHSDSSIVADLSEEQDVILKLAAPTGTVRFRKESTVMIRQTARERNLSEPIPVPKKKLPTLEPRPKPQPDWKIVKKPARHRPNLGPSARR
jgi:hypothetical protein